jgi:nucleotide-binding universal stress UspA family protein
LTYESVEKKIEVFRKAILPERIDFESKKIIRLLLAVDIHAYSCEASESALLLTSYLANRFNAKVFVVCIAPSGEETEESSSKVNSAVELLVSQDIIAEGICGEGFPSENILRFAEKEMIDCIIIPTPYAEKTEKPCIESLGTTVDIVLQRAPCSIMLVKGSVQEPETVVKNILLSIQSVKEYMVAEWALTLVDEDSKILLLNVVDKSLVKNTKDVVEKLLKSKIIEDSIEGMLQKDVNTLMVNIAKKGHEKRITVKRRFRVGEEVNITLEEMKKEGSSMLILATKPNKVNKVG